MSDNKFNYDYKAKDNKSVRIVAGAIAAAVVAATVVLAKDAFSMSADPEAGQDTQMISVKANETENFKPLYEISGVEVVEERGPVWQATLFER